MMGFIVLFGQSEVHTTKCVATSGFVLAVLDAFVFCLPFKKHVDGIAAAARRKSNFILRAFQTRSMTTLFLLP